LLILHDVINYGATPIKEIDDVKRSIRGKNQCMILGILSILSHEHGGLEFVKENTGVPIEAIISWNDMKKAVQLKREKDFG